MRSMTLRKAKQKGFTLLELLVVITLLAILATGALLAYEGLTDTAQGAGASKNAATADQSVRNYKAVTGNYPDQWDNLLVSGAGASVTATGTEGSLPTFMPSALSSRLANLTLSGASGLVADAFEAVGIEEIQTRLVNGKTLNIEPNLQHNEGSVSAVSLTDVAEVEIGDLNRVAVVPTFNGTGCTLQTGIFPTATIDGTAVGLANANYLNKVNDAFGTDECHLVVALGFGKDAAQSTAASPVAIAAAPTHVSKNVNPADTYARYIGLFHVAEDADEDGIIQNTEIFKKARLIAVVDTEGNVIDQNIAVANDNTPN